MSKAISIVQELEAAALSPYQAVMRTLKETGKEAIGCFPIYTPEELIYAAGMIPVGMWGGDTELKLADRYLQTFCCSIMRSNIEYSMMGAYDMLKAVIIPTFCDTLKCICENWKVSAPHIPVIPMAYPQNRRIEAGFVYMTEELERVRGELETISGKPITEAMLEEAFAVYEAYRSAMREFVKVAVEHPETINAKSRHLIIKAGYFSDKKAYTDKIRMLTEALKEESVKPFHGIKVVATGLIAEPPALLDIFVKNNVAIAADDLAQESRQFRTLSRSDGSVIERLSWRVVDQQGCTFLYEVEKTRGQMLIEQVKETGSKGVVIFMMKFCDPEEFDYPVYKEELEQAGIPVLYLETEQQMDSFAQIQTRVQSFAEMLA
ncbi:MAG TPA: 2-hydroxyacyl-CoA dehydratase [Clostridiales bacterium]|nr:2-hydroxyacyl-CoA dehydratase [Clostridiales bacterium]